MCGGTIVIFTAVQLEARAIASLLGLHQKSHGAWESARTNISIELYVIGIRACRLPQIDASAVQCVVMAGLAGGLSPSVKVGDVILDDCPAPWKEKSGLPTGLLHTAKEVIATPADKARLFTKTAALAVEMENQIVRKWAVSRGFSLVCIRAISDAADEGIDPAMLRLIDPYGQVRPRALVKELILNPRILPRLLRLGRNSKFAVKALAKAVQSLIQHMA